MIVTLTVNPSLDRTLTVDAPLRPGAVQTATSSREDAGGKGINVAGVVAAAGEDCLAVLPLASDDPFDSALRRTPLRVERVPVGGRVRTNLAITDPEGVTTKLNLPGAALSPDEASATVEAVVRATVGARWLVLAGSLPPGVDEDFYVRVIHAVRRSHATPPLIAVDASGAALTAATRLGAPDLIKPNAEELAELAGVSLDAEFDAVAVLEVARSLVPARVGAVLVTLGADGAILVDATGAWAATPPPIRVVSTVGAGDSALAGYVLAHARRADPQERLRHAVRYGAAAASLPGTLPPTPADLPTGDVPVIRLA